MSYRRVQKESDELLYTVRSLVMVRNRLPTQVVEDIYKSFSDTVENLKVNTALISNIV